MGDENQEPALAACPLRHQVVNGVRITDYREDRQSARYLRFWIECGDCGLELEGPLTHHQEQLPDFIRQWNARPSAWQAIDSAPKDGTWILTISKNGANRWTVASPLRWKSGRWDSALGDKFVVYHQPLYWMPLPSPPEQK